MFFWKVRTEPFHDAKEARRGMPIFLTMLLAAALFAGFKYLVEVVTTGLYEYVKMQVALYRIDPNEPILYDIGLILHSGCAAVLLLVASLYVRFLEGRRLSSMGLHKKGLLGHLLKGILLGAFLFAAVLGLLVFSGNFLFEGETQTDLVVRLLCILSVLLYGFSFEYYFRGFVLSSLGARSRMITAVLLTALLSTAAQSYYWGYSFNSIANTLLLDLTLGFLVCRTGSLYQAGAARACFLFACQFLFGTMYSGAAYEHAIFPTTVNYANIWVGTENGIDNGNALTVILFVALLLVVFIPKREPKAEEEPAPFIPHVPVESENTRKEEPAQEKPAGIPDRPSAPVLRRPESLKKPEAAEPAAPAPAEEEDDEEEWEEEEKRAHVEPDYKKPEDYLK